MCSPGKEAASAATSVLAELNFSPILDYESSSLTGSLLAGGNGGGRLHDHMGYVGFTLPL